MASHDQTNCALCDLAVGRHPFTRRFAEAEKTFCCMGCMNVYAILHESGALAGGQDIRSTDLFKRSLAMGLISNGEKADAADIPADAPRQEMLLQVSGMWCSSCAWLIEHALQQERGVVTAEAFFASDLVKINYCPQYVPPGRLTKRLSELGYQASEYTGEQEHAQAERRDLLLRIGIAGFLWLNLMTLSTPLYVSFFEPIGGSFRTWLPFVLMALATPVIFYSAMPIMRLAWGALRERTLRMESLLGLGILAAYVYSTIQAFRGDAHVYFDTAAAIVTLVLLGKLIERNAKERTGRALTMLHRLMPKKVRLLAGEAERFVAIDALSLDDVFMVKAGERIPADGVIVHGSTHVDEALLTGESAPIAKAKGDIVVAGSMNTGGVIEARATRIGGDTTLAQIIRSVEHALSSRSKLERTVDRLARVFVPIVIVIAFCTWLGWWMSGATTMGEAVMRAITVLVIACPCALGMATPLALTAAIGTASRRGILVSDSRVLETVRRVDTVIFDKTGTITEGDFALVDYATIATSKFATVGDVSFAALAVEFEIACLPMLAALERYSEHPLGRAVVRAAEQRNLVLPQAREIEIHKGEGLTGQVYGKCVFIGNRRLAEREALTFAEPAAVSDWQADGRTIAYFGWNGVVRGALAFGDRVKADAAATVKALQQRGVRVLLVSGDAHAATERVAHAIGADEFIAGALPADKVAVIAQQQQRDQVVAMIGDGVNDAPALAQADLGIAVSSGADIAMQSAAIVLLGHTPSRVLAVFALANKSWRVVRQNLFWAFLYNTLGISLAVTGVLNPLMAAVAMLLSSLSVIGNSLRLNRDT